MQRLFILSYSIYSCFVVYYTQLIFNASPQMSSSHLYFITYYFISILAFVAGRSLSLHSTVTSSVSFHSILPLLLSQTTTQLVGCFSSSHRNFLNSSKLHWSDAPGITSSSPGLISARWEFKSPGCFSACLLFSVTLEDDSKGSC